MSLTLARLCGEWRLVSGNYKLVSGNYEARGASGGKYKAQIVIFRIFAAMIFSYFLESGKPLRKIRKPLKKLESR